MRELLRDLAMFLRSRLSRRVGSHRAKDIMIFSTARSGSTWVQEVIASQQNIKFVSEPLLMEGVTRRQLGAEPSWALTMPGGERESVLRDYFDRLFAGRCGYGSPLIRSEFFRWRYNRVVLKLLRGQDLMNWCEANFDVKIVYLLRHPIPVALSRDEYKRLPLFLENELFCNAYLSEAQLVRARAIFNHGSELERKVLDWVLQNIVPLKFSNRGNWLCLYYEDIVLNPDPQLQRLINDLDLDDLAGAKARLLKASASTHKSDETTQEFLEQGSALGGGRAFLVEKWLSKVGLAEQRAVQGILDTFDIDVYRADSALPVYTL
jgi:hypothetical protein